MNTLQNYARNSFYIKFYPSLLSFTGCEKATLIAGKLEYWFSNPKYERGFYKFIEPCAHPLYREGDSWSEELGISRKLFAKAFNIIGVRYNSKSAYLKAEDKFQGKLYASFHDRKTNRTYFVRNHEFTSQLLEKLKASYYSVKQKVKKSVEPTLENNSPKKKPFEKKYFNKISSEVATFNKTFPQKTTPISALSNLSQGRSRNGDLGRSYVRGSFSLHKETSSLERKILNSPSEPNRHLEEETEEMIKIWREEVGELGVSGLSNGFFQKLQNVFKEFFDLSLESWKAYCQMISSSKFLMGEAQNQFFKKAWITWAIRGDNIERIKGGDFRLGDRQTNQDKEIEVIDREIRSVEFKKHQIEIKIANIKSNEREKRKEIIKEKIKNLSEQERHILEKDFEALLEEENNSMTEEFRKFRWKGRFISAYFEGFVEGKIYAELFKKAAGDNDEKIVQSSGLLELLEDACEELAHVKRKKRMLEIGSKTFESKDLETKVIGPRAQESCSSETFSQDSVVNLRSASPLVRAQNTPGNFVQENLAWT
ncbi:MAG: hypothetical protein WAV13_11415 [Thermodesulfovibrionales bacterium]